jgi:hypothetical protein
MKQIVNDLQNNANDRLKLWIKDTIMRCEAVDLEDREGVSIILTALAHELTYGLVKLGMTRQDFMIIMQRAFELEKSLANVSESPCEDGK